MNRPTDPAFEIRDALDREVRRSFDAGKLVAVLEEDRAAGRAAARAERGRGPFGRVPVPIQWIGVAGAVIAAATGLRSLYLELTAPEPRPAAVERASAEQPATPLEQAAPPRAEVEAPPVVEPPVRDPAGGTVPAVPPAESRDKTSEAPRVTQVAESVGPPSAEPPIGTSKTSPGDVHAAPLSPPAAARPDSTTQGPSRDRPSAPDAIASGVTATLPGVAPAIAGGVRVTSMRLAGRVPLVTELREVPEIGATLVTIRGLEGRDRRRRIQSPESPAPATEPGAAAASEGSFFLRVLVGSAFEQLPQDNHAWLGERVSLVPASSAQPWEPTEARRRFLETSFGLRSIVTLEGVRIPAPAAGSVANLVAVGGGKLYEIVARAAPAEVEGRHTVTIELRRKHPGRPRDAEPAIDATLSLDDGAVAVLAVPDPLRSAVAPEREVDTLFVCVSPPPAPFVEPRRVLESMDAVVEQPDQPPILVEREEPLYPVEAAEFDPHGEVTLRALIGSDGTVGSVTVLDLPRGDGAEFLAAAAAGAVRRWRWLPAQHSGREVPTHVDITLSF